MAPGLHDATRAEKMMLEKEVLALKAQVTDLMKVKSTFRWTMLENNITNQP
jgi:hypothetical protein